MNIEFPIIRIDSQNWLDSEELVPLFDGYMYSSKYQIYKDYYQYKEFADCKGNIYRIIDRILPTNFWRNIFRFLPGVYKVKLVFISTSKKIELEELQRDIIKGIKRFDTNDTKEASENWIKEILNSKNIREVLTGENNK